MKVLHLIDTASPSACSTTLTLIDDLVNAQPGVEARMCIIGRGGAAPLSEDLAEGMASLSVDRLRVPFGGVVPMCPLFRRYLKREGPFDLIHCWSLSAMTLASVAGGRTPCLVTLVCPPLRREGRGLRNVLRRRPAPLLPIRGDIADSLIRMGFKKDSIHVLPPGLNATRLEHEQRRPLRMRWGVNDEKIRVIHIPGDPPSCIDALRAMWHFGLNAEAGRPLRLLLPPEARSVDRVRRMLRSLGRSHWLVVDSEARRPWRVLPGCDIALALDSPLAHATSTPTLHAPIAPASTPGSGGSLGLLWTMIAEVPIIGEDMRSTREALPSAHPTLVSAPARPREIARHIRRLLDQPRFAADLAAAGANHARGLCDLRLYAGHQTLVYEQLLAGQPLTLPSPHPASTANMERA